MEVAKAIRMWPWGRYSVHGAGHPNPGQSTKKAPSLLKPIQKN